MLEQTVYRLDQDKAYSLIAAHPWVTLVSDAAGGLAVSHLPVVAEQDGERITVLGHLGRRDAELHGLGEHDVALIVQGPHGYVSPAFYRNGPYVPTWNFVVAHLYGRPEILSDDQTYEVLNRTVDQFERNRPEPFRLSSVEQYAKSISPGTTGFRLVPTRIAAKAKLSQDKPADDRTSVIDGLEHDIVHGNADLAAAMRTYENRS